MRPTGTGPRARRHLILGNSAAGLAAAEEIRRHDRHGQVTILSDEPVLAYSRPMLPLYIAGARSARGIQMVPRAYYASRRLRLLRAEGATSVDTAARLVHTSRGRAIPYDTLLIATGSSPRSLGVPGEALPGVHPLRSLADADAIRRGLAASAGAVVIVGGGLVGVKTVEALAGRRRALHLLISSDRILSQMLDRRASEIFLQACRRSGVAVHFHADVAAFLGRERLEAVRLSDGTELPCALAVLGKGVRPNLGCLTDGSVALQQGVRVDACMATTAPGVYAAGDVAEPLDALRSGNAPSAIWPSAREGGRVAGANMAGAPAAFAGALRMNAVEILGVRAVSAGDWDGPEALVHAPAGTGDYRKLVWRDGRLAGFLAVGDIRGAGALTALVKSRSQVSAGTLARELPRGFSFRPRLYALGGTIGTSGGATP
jgi:NAD(P)H-nitrite reductase large subunit